MTKKERITITISPDLLHDLDEMCAQSGYSRSFIIWRCIRLYMKLLDERINMAVVMYTGTPGSGKVITLPR